MFPKHYLNWTFHIKKIKISNRSNSPARAGEILILCWPLAMLGARFCMSRNQHSHMMMNKEWIFLKNDMDILVGGPLPNGDN